MFQWNISPVNIKLTAEIHVFKLNAPLRHLVKMARTNRVLLFGLTLCLLVTLIISTDFEKKYRGRKKSQLEEVIIVLEKKCDMKRKEFGEDAPEVELLEDEILFLYGLVCEKMPELNPNMKTRKKLAATRAFCCIAKQTS